MFMQLIHDIFKFLKIDFFEENGTIRSKSTNCMFMSNK